MSPVLILGARVKWLDVYVLKCVGYEAEWIGGLAADHQVWAEERAKRKGDSRKKRKRSKASKADGVDASNASERGPKRRVRKLDTSDEDSVDDREEADAGEEEDNVRDEDQAASYTSRGTRSRPHARKSARVELVY